ncbi:E3 ubiquitin-protein ligase TRIM56-like [Acanthaster planci]|uniref:E3 ubiquitin-protein ligase TRIM56-like n=1 Tax=Acanthaster planci TaxID=133434 RepID=A0A8B7Z407_ACAPL|nr:E3 ubiquitin-protein ligase TRIM56-like [Acanthaster planci]
MAVASVKSVLGTISRGHLECPICCCRYTDPKILDCLHSFCLNCLEELTGRQQAKADHITCPVCRQETAVPDTGLQGLPTCFFLSSLVDEINKQERLLGKASGDRLTCEECDEGLEAVSRCVDCNKVICIKCQEAHERLKSMKNHRIVRQLGQMWPEITPADLRKDAAPLCTKHKNQELCFYCETCQTLACGKCAALDHRTAEHEYRDVADAIRSFREDVDKILEQWEQSKEEFRTADDSFQHARNRLGIMADRACRDITAKEEEEIAKIKNKSRLLRDKVRQIKEQRDKKFEGDQKSNRDQINRAEQIVATVNDLMQQADDFELLDLKPKVMHNLQFQKGLELGEVKHDLSFIGVKCHDVVKKLDIGEILPEEKWQLNLEFGREEWEDGEMHCVADVAFLSSGDISATDTKKEQVMIFNSTGEYITIVSRRELEKPQGIATTSDDLLLVCDGKHVKVFDSSLEFVRQFSPAQEDTEGYAESDLGGIAVDKENRIAVADYGRKLISLHNLDGSLISIIEHHLVDWDLAVGVQERLIFTNYDENVLICTTYAGKEIFTISTLFDGEPARPLGVCCDEAGDIYVVVDTMATRVSRVLHYTGEGVFVGQVTYGLNFPGGLTFSPSGDLVVVDMNSVRIYQQV